MKLTPTSPQPPTPACMCELNFESLLQKGSMLGDLRSCPAHRLKSSLNSAVTPTDRREGFVVKAALTPTKVLKMLALSKYITPASGEPVVLERNYNRLKLGPATLLPRHRSVNQRGPVSRDYCFLSNECVCVCTRVHARASTHILELETHTRIYNI